MARIAVVSECLNDQVFDLAKSLRSQHHDVFIITGSKEKVENSDQFQILQYFKKWSATEAAKFFLKILPLNLEIWHFVYPDQDKINPKAAHIVLANMARSFPRKVIATSFYDEIPENFLTKIFIKSCDIVTTATREDLMSLKRKLWPSRFCELEVLPPVSIYAQASHIIDPLKAPDLEELAMLIKAIKPYIFIPSNRKPYLEWNDLETQYPLLFNDRRPGKKPLSSPANYHFTGKPLSGQQLEFVLKNSRAVLIAFQNIPMSDLILLQRLCSLHKVPIVANPRQAEALPGLCVPKRNGFHIQSKLQFQILVSSNSNLDIPTPKYEAVKSEVLDTSVNELNRLYSKVRSLKEIGVAQTKWQS